MINFTPGLLHDIFRRLLDNALCPLHHTGMISPRTNPIKSSVSKSDLFLASLFRPTGKEWRTVLHTPFKTRQGL
jgi:hypothetical protein